MGSHPLPHHFHDQISQLDDQIVIMKTIRQLLNIMLRLLLYQYKDRHVQMIS